MKVERWMATIALLAGLPVAAAAQSDSGRISGSVRDQTSAFVVDATVTIKNDRTGEVRTAKTNADGFFLVSPLRPSTYTIKVEKAGFGVLEYPQMPLAVGQELTLDFELKPAGVQESVTVVGTAPTLDISSARMGANVSEREVQGLPVNGRQMSQLLLQAPGSQNAGDGTWQDIRFSGRANEQNVIKYDGVEGSAIIDASPGNVNGENQHAVQAAGEPRERPGIPRRIEQLPRRVRHRHRRPGERHHQVGQQQLPWRRLRVPSQRQARRARIISTRSAQHDDSVISEGPKSKLKQNQFGGSFGGPIMKDRAFFFGSYEGYRLDAGKNIVEAVPSDAAWARAVPAVAAPAAGIHGARRRHPAGRVHEPRLRHRAAPGHAERQGERLQRPVRLQDERRTGRPTSASSTTRARTTSRRA